MPGQIARDLGLDVRLELSTAASYTPVVRDGMAAGLLVESPEGSTIAESFHALTGSDEDYQAWRTFYTEVADFAGVVAPTLLSPLRTAREMHALVKPEVWEQLVERPLGTVIEERFQDDTGPRASGHRRADRQRDEAVRRALEAIDEHLEEPIEDCLARRARSPVHRGEGSAGRRRIAGDARWPPLPRRAVVAVGAEPGPPRVTGAEVGRRHRPAQPVPLRRRCQTCWSRQRRRRSQRGARRTGVARPLTALSAQTSLGTTDAIGSVVGCSEPPDGSMVIATSIPSAGISIAAPLSGSSRRPADAGVPSVISHSW